MFSADDIAQRLLYYNAVFFSVSVGSYRSLQIFISICRPLWVFTDFHWSLSTKLCSILSLTDSGPVTVFFNNRSNLLQIIRKENTLHGLPVNKSLFHHPGELGLERIVESFQVIKDTDA